MTKLSDRALNDGVIRPDYDRGALRSRIVHLGFGAFHRAHQAVLTDAVARHFGGDWGICEVSLMTEQPILDLRAQGHQFAVIERGPEVPCTRIVGAVTEALHPKLDGIASIVAKMAEPQVAIVSLTITEKGYCIDPGSGRLDLDNPMVQRDLDAPDRPASAIGVIVQALRLRRTNGVGGLSVMSCDNIQGNGQVTRNAVTDFARLRDPDLADWIKAHVSFPSTMVDRIVPAVTPETAREIAEILGSPDPCGVVCEPFIQWVIEDDFVAGRPDWQAVGAQFVSDVTPFEEMKLRMLNGSHSFLAYLGYLAGYETIFDAVSDPDFRRAAFDMMMLGQAPSLDLPAGTSAETYAQQLIQRFANPGLKHKTWQIAMDGSQKIPQRFGGGLLHHLRQGTEFRWHAAGIAAWMRYVAGTDEAGRPIDVRDPMAAQLRAICDRHGPNTSVVQELLGLEAVFPGQIGQSERVQDAVAQAYQSLIDNGAKATVAAL